MKMKMRPSLLGLLLGVAAMAAHAQHTHHDHAPAQDARAVLQLDEHERALILEEMRSFLAGVQKMAGAIARQDMPATAEAARAMGMNMTHEVPPALRAKLPQAFRQLGASVHRDFDQIALDADSLKDPRHSLEQLSATLQKCVACHATYQIRPSGHPARH